MEQFDMGANLKAVRRARGLSVSVLLDELRRQGVVVSKSTYYAWEEGDRTIPHKYILPLCMVLHVTIDFLYVLHNDSPALADKVENIKSIEAFLRNLDEDTCRMLIELARHWDGDLRAALIMLGVYSAQPVEMRRDIANLCLHNYLCAVRDGDADRSLSGLLDIDYCETALTRINKM